MNQHLVVIGLGYVGLPLAQEAASSGLRVTGLDINALVVESLNKGRSHVDDLSDSDVIGMKRNGFTATTDPRTIATADVVVICVPTPLSNDGGPDLRAVTGATEMCSKYMQKNLLVILESTTYPGTTDELVRPILERSGLNAGVDFNLAFSPERIDPGNIVYGPKNTPKVVGGHTPTCTARACSFYEAFVDVTVPTRGTREAEMAKLLENTYRHVNIAMMNEMARFCHELDIDLWDVISAAKSKPFGFQAFYPGPGVGGHCIPIDPNYLSHNVESRLGYPFRFVELAQEINNRMPAYIVERTQDILNDRSLALRGAHILLLGVTYKANIADQRESPATEIAEKFLTKGAMVSFHDPYVLEWTTVSDAHRVQSPLDAASDVDVVILLQHHAEYDVDQIANASKTLFDTRGVSKAGIADVYRL